MRYFVDTEFREWPIGLVSIGIVAEDGREFYGINTSFDWGTASEWLRENVRPHLNLAEGGSVFADFDWFPDLIRDFIGDDPHPEFWGYYCAYDYVVLSQIMGGMEGWPQGWPYLMYDLRQWLDHEALYHIEQNDGTIHNALLDARWVRKTFLQHSHGSHFDTPSLEEIERRMP